jgi:Phosphatidylglycerol lysyltransferase, C-terminal
MLDCGVAAFAFSPLNAAPKIALGKWDVVQLDGALALVSGDGVHRVLPIGAREQYWGAILDLLHARKTLALIPQWAAEALRKRYKVTKQHEEFISATADVIALPGGRNQSLRNYVNRARKNCDIEPLAFRNAVDFLKLNALWYRQNSGLKFRTYDKTSIDWLLREWGFVQQAVPDALCYGVRRRSDMQLIAFAAGCVLTASCWTSYTRRFDRDCGVTSPHFLCHVEMAKAFAGLPEENDGTAESKTLRAPKERLALRTTPYFVVKG